MGVGVDVVFSVTNAQKKTCRTIVQRVCWGVGLQGSFVSFVLCSFSLLTKVAANLIAAVLELDNIITARVSNRCYKKHTIIWLSSN